MALCMGLQLQQRTRRLLVVWSKKVWQVHVPRHRRDRCEDYVTTFLPPNTKLVRRIVVCRIMHDLI
jgi:hypothetical protein